MSDEGMSDAEINAVSDMIGGAPYWKTGEWLERNWPRIIARLDAAERELSALREQHSTVCDTAVQACTERDAAERERDALREALTQIASFEDSGANRRLSATGSYSAFDEPGSVEISRAALTANHSAPVVEE